MKILFLLISLIITIYAHSNNIEKPTLDEAYQILQSQNIEIKIASSDMRIAKEKKYTIDGKNWGKLDFIQDVSRSNDAGNVFGFKLTSREANFGDFGFGAANMPAQNSPAYLTTPPDTLNYPEDRNFFQSKIRYEVPLFTGFALSAYSQIMQKMILLKSLDKTKVLNEKKYELKKAYYKMALLENSIRNLQKIMQNIETLKDMTQNMIDVGYAKHVDLLEIQAKEGNLTRLLLQMNANKKLLLHYISFLLNKKVIIITTPTAEVKMPSISDTTVLAHTLEIKKATLGLAIEKNMLTVQKAKYYPTLGAFAEIATADNTFLGKADKHKSYTLGARLTWNIFDGGINSARIEEAKLKNQKMKYQVALVKQSIILKLAKIHTEIKNSEEEIFSLKKELVLANAIYENYAGRYREKLVSMSDVILKQSSQIEKILQLLVANNRKNEKIFALEKLANQGK